MMRLDFWIWPVDFQYGCPLWVITGQTDKFAPCPLHPQLRNLGGASESESTTRIVRANIRGWEGSKVG
jgi:hypothetical protein